MAIGDDLHNLASSLLKLMHATDSIQEKIALRRQLTAVLEETERIIGVNIDTASAEYAAATRGIDGASAAINASLEDLSKVAATIETVAKTIDLLSKLAAQAGLI